MTVIQTNNVKPIYPKLIRRLVIFNYAFQDTSVILIAAILKIGLWQFCLYQLNVNRLILTHERSPNKMVPFIEILGHILNHK